MSFSPKRERCTIVNTAAEIKAWLLSNDMAENDEDTGLCLVSMPTPDNTRNYVRYNSKDEYSPPFQLLNAPCNDAGLLLESDSDNSVTEVATFEELEAELADSLTPFTTEWVPFENSMMAPEDDPYYSRFE